MTDRWVERRREMLERTGPDAALVRQQLGYARRFVDILGRRLDEYDALEALRDTGLCLAVDSEGVAGDARRWGVLLVAADPLDQDPAVDSHWDREAEGRDEAARRPNTRRLKGEDA